MGEDNSPDGESRNARRQPTPDEILQSADFVLMEMC